MVTYDTEKGYMDVELNDASWEWLNELTSETHHRVKINRELTNLITYTDFCKEKMGIEIVIDGVNDNASETSKSYFLNYLNKLILKNLLALSFTKFNITDENYIINNVDMITMHVKQFIVEDEQFMGKDGPTKVVDKENDNELFVGAAIMTFTDYVEYVDNYIFNFNLTFNFRTTSGEKLSVVRLDTNSPAEELMQKIKFMQTNLPFSTPCMYIDNIDFVNNGSAVDFSKTEDFREEIIKVIVTWILITPKKYYNMIKSEGEIIWEEK